MGVTPHVARAYRFSDASTHGASATATSTVTPALLSAHQAGWVSKETAMRLFYAMTGQEVNVPEELERIAREQEGGDHHASRG